MLNMSFQRTLIRSRAYEYVNEEITLLVLVERPLVSTAHTNPISRPGGVPWRALCIRTYIGIPVAPPRRRCVYQS